MTTKRRRFQIHLSTCIVAMFVAGALVWANTRATVWASTSAEVPLDPRYMDEMIKSRNAVFIGEGWPWDCVYLPARLEIDKKRARGVLRLASGPDAQGREATVEYGWLVLDALVAVVILLTAVLLCEYIIRRRPQQAQDGSNSH